MHVKIQVETTSVSRSARSIATSPSKDYAKISYFEMNPIGNLKQTTTKKKWTAGGKHVDGESIQTMHVVPNNDLKPHKETGEDCECKPVVEVVQCDDKPCYHLHPNLVVHNSWDGRELWEVNKVSNA